MVFVQLDLDQAEKIIPCENENILKSSLMERNLNFKKQKILDILGIFQLINSNFGILKISDIHICKMYGFYKYVNNILPNVFRNIVLADQSLALSMCIRSNELCRSYDTLLTVFNFLF